MCECALLLLQHGWCQQALRSKIMEFFSHRHRSIHHISLCSAESKVKNSIAKVRKPWSKVNWVHD